MALTRLTPTTALPAIRQAAAELERCVKDAGPLTGTRNISEGISRLRSYGAGQDLEVEIIIEEPLSEEAGARIRRVLGLSDCSLDLRHLTASEHGVPLGRIAAVALSGRFRSASDCAAVRTGVPRAPVLVYFSNGEPTTAFGIAAHERPLVLVVAPPNILQNQVERIRQTAWIVSAVSSEHSDAALTPWLVGTLTDASFDLLRADSVARALESVAAAFGLVLEQEARGLKAKRAIAQQRAALLPSRPSSGAAELLVDIRATLQRHFAEFARGADERFTSAFGLQIGSEWQAVDTMLNDLNVLDQEKRAKSVGLHVPVDFEDAWIATLRGRLANHCAVDLIALRDLFGVAAAEVERKIGAAAGPPIRIQFQFVQDERLERLLRMAALQRRYQGEMPRAGPIEYLMIARRYQTVVLMLISAFGLSFLRTYRLFMVPMAVLLMSLGGLSVANSVRKERREISERELEKARESLRSEGRRLVVETQRAWISLLGQHLTDQLSVAAGQVEPAIREQETRRAADVTQERQRLQRQLQGFESQERKLVLPSKARDSIVTTLAQLRGELRQLVVASLSTRAKNQ